MTYAIQQWAYVFEQVARFPPGQRVEYLRSMLCHPLEAGAQVSVGWPVGQTADYRFPPDSSCRGLHVHEYATMWVVHLDQVHPECDMGEHLRRDAPAAWCVGGAVLGAALGAAMSKQEGGALAGAGLGLLAAALFLPRTR